ncbi:hypothetical protein UFOVP642_13 [uncultured Caudovirales phage]|uniref:Uncharacterized protein n=1 Tax=uncultured Caudovirales phage TaxID=2100421 RepID=A0A6J5N736_9CAUD|nr:hypothetical protein UFOVP642_13 [uncultured Caudovirales phage]
MEQTIEVQEIARPKHRKPIDQELIYKLAAIHCSNKEIGSIVGIHIDSLQRYYGDVIRAGRDSGKGKLRRKMWEQALNGNPTMMIWLSKNHLGMTDAVLVSDDKKPLPWSDEDTKLAEPNATTLADTGVIYTEVHEDLDALKLELKGI